MPTLRYALGGGADALEVTWTDRWQQAAVQQGETVLRSFDDPLVLSKGTDVRLADGRTVRLRLRYWLGRGSLEVTQGGSVLVAEGHQGKWVWRASALNLAVGGFLLVNGLARVFSVNDYSAPQLSMQAALLGAVAVWVGVLSRRGSAAALVVALATGALLGPREQVRTTPELLDFCAQWLLVGGYLAVQGAALDERLSTRRPSSTAR